MVNMETKGTGEQDRTGISCYACGQNGHYQTQCKYRRMTDSSQYQSRACQPRNIHHELQPHHVQATPFQGQL